MNSSALVATSRRRAPCGTAGERTAHRTATAAAPAAIPAAPGSRLVGVDGVGDCCPRWPPTRAAVGNGGACSIIRGCARAGNGKAVLSAAQFDYSPAMPPRKWVVFADDTGDPGERGSPYFGYALFAVDRVHIPEFTRFRTEFRFQIKLWAEAKGGNVNSPRFRESIECLQPLLDRGRATIAACVIAKARYGGPWLRTTENAPADPTFLRNYLVRKTLELGFDGVDWGDGDSLELVLDRVDYSDRQVLNLRRYLDSDFAELGAFAFPRVTHVTHGDSTYIDGLQVADHLARLSGAIAGGAARLESENLARRWMRIATVIAGRSFTLSSDARGALSRRTRPDRRQ